MQEDLEREGGPGMLMKGKNLGNFYEYSHSFLLQHQQNDYLEFRYEFNIQAYLLEV